MNIVLLDDRPEKLLGMIEQPLAGFRIRSSARPDIAYVLNYSFPHIVLVDWRILQAYPEVIKTLKRCGANAIIGMGWGPEDQQAFLAEGVEHFWGKQAGFDQIVGLVRKLAAESLETKSE